MPILNSFWFSLLSLSPRPPSFLDDILRYFSPLESSDISGYAGHPSAAVGLVERNHPEIFAICFECWQK